MSDRSTWELAKVLLATNAITRQMHLAKTFQLAQRDAQFDIMSELISMGYEVRAVHDVCCEVRIFVSTLVASAYPLLEV